MFRFEANKGFYLYPESNNDSDLILKLNKGSTYEKVVPRDDVSVIKHGLKIPDDATSYSDFVVKRGIAEAEFKQAF